MYCRRLVAYNDMFFVVYNAIVAKKLFLYGKKYVSLPDKIKDNRHGYRF